MSLAQDFTLTPGFAIITRETMELSFIRLSGGYIESQKEFHISGETSVEMKIAGMEQKSEHLLEESS